MENKFNLYKTTANIIFKDFHEKMKSGDSLKLNSEIGDRDLLPEIIKLFKANGYRIEENGESPVAFKI